ncbi:16S rRNA (guanine(966)-N(2))-methyltransferase RsmD [Prosthecobacter sp.]|uniref:16S rRNA (guanine(966)-N(2))-methyltransferase RsmD n=1 Tax=Prosthecobacter sp. TaxID=1965333 RepID=UPI002AB88A71|nr:16S rRNA (guanine(966)-N(2))-methyltransferase RsmD [Prosthecobacter sp.]MDZ4404788.1 16S rRNA (guanine(966)-N(2))-methyltransferase RsmD [Prosthecobacter sp.]
MRIISGTAGGLALEVPKTVTRPTQDRVRQAVFSMLGELVPGAHVLDLFAGTGAIALECLSRGATSALMVDENKGACDVIRRNIAKTKLAGATVRQSDVFRLLPLLQRDGKQFDLIFADPPYTHCDADTDFVAKLLADEALPALLHAESHLILESHHFNRETKNWPGWEVLTDRNYGSTRIVWLRKLPHGIESA